ncbi:type II toxin-antitoxin system prevent-host-death family antitoxin [bacterium]|nr:type II toxin-antitoxin system prevent-host-death family antitoxin [bacterium]
MSTAHSENLIGDDFLSVTDARHEFFNMLNNVEKSDRSYTLTRKGKPIAQLLNFEQWKGILTTLEILVNPSHKAKLDKRIEETRRGKTVSFEQVFKHD